MPYTLLNQESPEPLPDNPLFKILNSLFIRVFADFDSLNMRHSCYVPHAGPIDHRIFASPDRDLAEHPLLGHYEADILHFALYGTQRTLILSGAVGSGKTTVLQNSKVIAKTTRLLSRRIRLIYLNFNTKKRLALQESGSSITKLRRHVFDFVHDRILDVIEKELKSIGGMWDEFWNYAWEQEAYFSKYRVACQMLDPENASSYRKARQLEFTNDPHYIDCLTRFFSMKSKKRILVIIDNVDPLPRHIHELLIWFTNEFRSHKYIRIVLSMRDNTKQALLPSLNPLDALQIAMDPPDIPEILKRRAAFLESACDDFKVKKAVREQLQPYGLAALDAKELITYFIDAALSDQVLSDLHRISNYNARLALKMSRTYFSSSYIHSKQLAKIMRAESAGISWNAPEIPGHVLIQSVVTGNRQSYSGVSDFETIDNVWCDSSSHFPIAHFFKLLLLNYLNACNAPLLISQIMSTFTSVFFHSTDYHEYTTKNLRRALRGLSSKWLIETPEFLLVEQHHKLKDEDVVKISYGGRFYVDELAYRMDYFSYVKDQIFLAKRIPAASCITSPHFSDRYAESLRIVEYLMDQEEIMYRTLREDPNVWRRFTEQLAFRNGDLLQYITGRCVHHFDRLKDEHLQYTLRGADRLARLKARLTRLEQEMQSSE